MSEASPTKDRHPRFLAFEACFNVRDLGGYRGHEGRPTRWRVLYRADGLHRLTQPDLDSIGALGLRTVIDLRTRLEAEQSGTFRTDRCPLEFHHLPMVDVLTPSPDPTVAPPPADRGERYADLAEQGAPAIAAGLRLLAEPGSLPAVFHCSAGRDRTGMFAAFVLSLCGVSDDDIVADYLLTQQAKEVTERWVAANDPVLLTLWSRHPAELRNTRAETMVSFLAAMRSRHGSIPAFLEQSGVTAPVVDRLTAALLEP